MNESHDLEQKERSHENNWRQTLPGWGEGEIMAAYTVSYKKAVIEIKHDPSCYFSYIYIYLNHRI